MQSRSYREYRVTLNTFLKRSIGETYNRVGKENSKSTGDRLQKNQEGIEFFGMPDLYL
jgi:hypothetical protein